MLLKTSVFANRCRRVANRRWDWLRRSRSATFILIGVLLTGLAHAGLAAPPGAAPQGDPEDGSHFPQDTAVQSDTGTPPGAPEPPPLFEDTAFHGQATFVDQFHPGFHSAYSGPDSLDSGRRGDETFDLTFYAGFRPWAGAEIWVNPEVDQGFGLSNTLGIAGFPSAEAYKVGQSVPYGRIQRLFLRQTIDLGGQTRAITPDLNQLGGAGTLNEIVATVGKFSVTDIVDTNKYAHDPRNDFLNWAVVDSGAFDYAADAWGYSYGASAEWYQNWWTLRAGIFDGSVTPNSKFEQLPLGRQFQIVVEAEARYALFGQAGKVKLLGFQTRAKLAKFSELEQFFATNPNASDVDAESIRHIRNKFGGGLTIEQPITKDLGFFLRASLSDGRTEAYEFTDIDRSISTGLSLAGNRWNRPDDTVGEAFVVNAISKAHKDYFEQGDLGVLIGDGKLANAGPEQIMETYYRYAISSGISITADYQLVNHPGYAVDRGPVHVFGGRLHAQF